MQLFHAGERAFVPVPSYRSWNVGFKEPIDQISALSTHTHGKVNKCFVFAIYVKK